MKYLIAACRYRSFMSGGRCVQSSKGLGAASYSRLDFGASDDPGLEIVHQHVAGIDIGNKSHYVAVPPACDAEPVREFGSGTADLVRMAEWLKSGGIRHVVMQSTGVPEQAGFEICLSKARDTKKPAGA